MPKYLVTFEKDHVTVSVEAGTTLLQAAVEAGLHPDAPCGGKGKCGKCRMRYHSGDGVWKEVLGCTTKVTEPVYAELIEHTKPLHVLNEGHSRSIVFAPSVRRLHVTLPSRSENPGLSEWERLKKATGIEFEENLPMIRSLSDLSETECPSLQVVYRDKKVLDLYREEGTRRVLGAAFDIGTTSLAGYLMDLETGEKISTASEINPQFSFGADVIQRSNYVLENDGTEMYQCIREKLNELLGKMCAKAQADRRDVYQVSVVGNSCMHHLYLGISPWSMVHAPYQPAVKAGMIMSALEYGIQAAPMAEMLWLPLIAGFVGADTVGCLLSTELAYGDEIALMIDIGTNGEMVVGNRTRKIACSTAAGPALEGAKIACGMRGTDGAIEHVDLVDGKIQIKVIGNGKPTGICGSGLIDAIAVFLEAGIIDETGRMESEDRLDGQPVYWLAPPDAEGKGGVYLSQKDIREVQLAKGAIAAGVHLLADQLGIQVSDIQKVYLAGAFGTYLRPVNACRIGLIPQELDGRITAVGNAAGEGAKMILLNGDCWEDAEKLARHTEFLELASLPEFQDTFVDELEFPE